MASRQTFAMPASYINTRMILFPRIAIPSGGLDIPATLAATVNGIHQAVNSSAKHVCFSRVTFTAPSTAIDLTASSRRRHQHGSSEDTASISEYFFGPTDELGCALGRKPTPYPRRTIAGVEWTSLPTSRTSSSLHCGSNSEVKNVHFANTVTDFGSELTRTPTPYPHAHSGKKAGFKMWYKGLKRKICPVRETVDLKGRYSSSMRAMFGEEKDE